MAIPMLARQNSLRLLPAIAKLARWRFKQMWRFLFVTWLGMLAMVVLACAPPLFSRVAISADLRQAVAQAADGQNMLIQVASIAPTEQQIQQIGQHIDQVLKQSSFSTYLQGSPGMMLQTPPLDTLVVGSTKPSALILDGYDPAQTTQHTDVLQGRLPQETSDDTIEVALTQNAADTLHVHVGSVIQGHYPDTFNAQAWKLQVVGIIAQKASHDPFWLPDATPFSSLLTFDNGQTAYSALATSEAIRANLANLQIRSEKSAVRLFWSYPFAASRLDANNIAALAQQASDLRSQINEGLTHINGVTFAFPGGALFDILSSYSQQVVVLEVVATFLLLLLLAIVLFLVGMLANMLVERQAAIIAMLRSRGAARQHIFGAFVAQGVALGLAALLIGPILAIILVRVTAQALLTPANQQALDAIASDPIQAALDVKWFAIIAVLAALFVMIVAISRASKLDIVTLRHEVSRSRRIPLWRRLHLDFLAIAFIVVGSIVYVYFWQTIAATQTFDPVLYNLLRGLSFIAPPLLVAALLMLFLRLFPRILRLITALVTKRRSAPAVLAFAQMERASGPAARIIALLMLAIASSCFCLTLIATNNQRGPDAATFAVGADFSGFLPATDSGKTFDTLKTQYSQLSGVQSATIGYASHINRDAGDIRIMAVDADTYARTALWSTQNSSQSLSALTEQLITHRTDASTGNVVYALVDAALWQQLHLSQGDSFTLPMSDDGSLHMRFIAQAEVSYLPSIYDTPVSPDRGIGLLVDYQSYATVYAKNSGKTLSPNFVWLRSDDDTASLSSIRQALPDLNDRRMLTTANQQSGAHLDIIGMLGAGVAVAIILALIGTLLSSWLNAASRRTSFAVIRALGMRPRQIAAVLLWEQGFAYLLAFLLGAGLGIGLINFVSPIVSLLDLTGASASFNPYDIPPVQTQIPEQQLLLLLGGLAMICLAALVLMAWIVSRPSISQTLRLNED
ncbi:MAG TPA: FtsX-like permease family protein [Ktedonobacteraceae bacterium]|nr:FtsX-like permease family protein [Ktedonobacteraceae bacterium]